MIMDATRVEEGTRLEKSIVEETKTRLKNSIRLTESRNDVEHTFGHEMRKYPPEHYNDLVAFQVWWTEKVKIKPAQLFIYDLATPWGMDVAKTLLDPEKRAIPSRPTPEGGEMNARKAAERKQAIFGEIQKDNRPYFAYAYAPGQWNQSGQEKNPTKFAEVMGFMWLVIRHSGNGGFKSRAAFVQYICDDQVRATRDRREIDDKIIKSIKLESGEEAPKLASGEEAPKGESPALASAAKLADAATVAYSRIRDVLVRDVLDETLSTIEPLPESYKMSAEYISVVVDTIKPDERVQCELKEKALSTVAERVTEQINSGPRTSESSMCYRLTRSNHPQEEWKRIPGDDKYAARVLLSAINFKDPIPLDELQMEDALKEMQSTELFKHFAEQLLKGDTRFEYGAFLDGITIQVERYEDKEIARLQGELGRLEARRVQESLRARLATLKTSRRDGMLNKLRAEEYLAAKRKELLSRKGDVLNLKKAIMREKDAAVREKDVAAREEALRKRTEEQETNLLRFQKREREELNLPALDANQINEIVNGAMAGFSEALANVQTGDAKADVAPANATREEPPYKPQAALLSSSDSLSDYANLGVADVLSYAKSVANDEINEEGEYKIVEICKKLNLHPACSTVTDKNGERMCKNRKTTRGKNRKTDISCASRGWNETWELSDKIGKESAMHHVDFKTPLRDDERKPFAEYMSTLSDDSPMGARKRKPLKERLQERKLHWDTEKRMLSATPAQKRMWALSLVRTDLKKSKSLS